MHAFKMQILFIAVLLNIYIISYYISMYSRHKVGNFTQAERIEQVQENAEIRQQKFLKAREAREQKRAYQMVRRGQLTREEHLPRAANNRGLYRFSGAERGVPWLRGNAETREIIDAVAQRNEWNDLQKRLAEISKKNGKGQLITINNKNGAIRTSTLSR
jgi:hypothetical protein